MTPSAESRPRPGGREPAVRICDVTLRDGMQSLNRGRVISVDERLELYRLLESAGLPYIEVGSFVHPRVIPAMADTAELLERLPPPRAEIAVLIPKLAYYRMPAAAAGKVRTVAVFVSSSEHYSRANTRMSKEEAFEAAREVATRARADGYGVRGYLSCAFRDLGDQAPPMDAAVVRRDCLRLLELGCSSVSISDTEGRATPRDVERILVGLGDEPGFERLAVHFHDRFGQGIANAFSAFRLGVRTFDGSIGGIGGTRALRDAVGNVATEELVALFEGMGVATGVDGALLAEAGRRVLEMAAAAGDPAPPSKLLSRQAAGAWRAAAEQTGAAEPPAKEDEDEPRRRLAELVSAAARSRLGAAAIASVLTMLLVLLTGLLLTHVFSVFSIVRGHALLPGSERTAHCPAPELVRLPVRALLWGAGPAR